MHTSVSIDVAAPADLVFRLARDPLRWPLLLPHYTRARAISRSGKFLVCEFVARRPLVPILGIGFPVVWRSRTWAEPDRLQLRFRHVGGATRGMDVMWRIEPVAPGCRVTIEHDFRPRVGAWATFVDRAFARSIARRTLRGFKVLAEALANGSASGPEPRS